WQDHIDHLDVMRSGIGLRGMAQRDPLVEFKREAFQAFEQLKDEIEHHIVEYLFRAPVQIQLPEPPKEALPQNLRTNADAIAQASGQEKSAGALPAKANGNVAARLPAPAASGKNGVARSGAARNGTGRSQPAARHAHPAAKGSSSHPGKSGVSSAARPRPAATATANASNPGSVKVGRNDPCPCGSGRKYKMCHGR
ncbi:MAG TPA: SEC-C metal-binding domain-containing protein, partial [Ktedonobacterales bacterium]|nr:SEC-C metal-binding domain-containing protein [Ktedonobacterales bacterium]